MVDYLRQTSTEGRLTVRAERITRLYTTGKKVPDEIMALLNIDKDDLCPAWNYTIRPRIPAQFALAA